MARNARASASAAIRPRCSWKTRLSKPWVTTSACVHTAGNPETWLTMWGPWLTMWGLWLRIGVPWLTMWGPWLRIGVPWWTMWGPWLRIGVPWWTRWGP
eukprot:9471037-Pyramimonas_sp.AAC.1